MYEQGPKVIKAHRFIIGMSPEGKLGTYRVMKEIELEQQ